MRWLAVSAATNLNWTQAQQRAMRAAWKSHCFETKARVRGEALRAIRDGIDSELVLPGSA